MKKYIFFMIFVVVAFKGWGYLQKRSVKPLYNRPYIVVYGRDNCGYTRQTVKLLKQAHIKFEYLNIDDVKVRDILIPRMDKTGLDTSWYLLPIVDLNNSLMERPDNRNLIKEAKALRL